MFTKSLYTWCKENGREDLLARWNTNLNQCTPDQVGANSNKEWWFNCDKNHNHSPEKIVPNHFVSGRGRTSCKQCSSFGQWCVDTGREIFIDQWDYEKNKKSPFEVSKTQKKKCYFKCNENVNHEIYLSPDSIVGNGRQGLSCKTCNSFGSFVEKTFGEELLPKIWNFEFNNDDPFVIGAHSKKTVYFNCTCGLGHPSYKTAVAAFTEGHRCPYCSHNKLSRENSLGVVDSLSIGYWSSKNSMTPYDVHSNSNQAVWWKCNNGVHADYQRAISETRRYEYRCPECTASAKRSIIAQKAMDYISELGFSYSTEYDCPIITRNPKTNMPMPYDLCVDSLHLIIEIHGEQHYNEHFYKTRIAKNDDVAAEKMLRQRKIYDRFKRLKAKELGYSYLELPYYCFDEKNIKSSSYYKKLIDNAIDQLVQR